MNRAQKRSLVNNYTGKLYTEAEVRQIKRQCYQDANELSYNIYMEVVKFALRDEFGFAQSRMNRMFEKIRQILIDLENKVITLDDIREQMKEELPNLVVR